MATLHVYANGVQPDSNQKYINNRATFRVKINYSLSVKRSDNESFPLGAGHIALRNFENSNPSP